jgi:hypothetical protein
LDYPFKVRKREFACAAGEIIEQKDYPLTGSAGGAGTAAD